MPTNITNINYGVSTDYYQGRTMDMGVDTDTGEKITRQKTFVKTPVAGAGEMDIDKAIIATDTQADANITANKGYNAASLMFTKGDLLGTRGYLNKAKVPVDRKDAEIVFNKIIALCSNDPAVTAAGIKKYAITAKEIKAFANVTNKPALSAAANLGLADLALKQFNDNEPTCIKTETAILYCQNARIALNAVIPANEKDSFKIAKSYIIEAKFRAINGEDSKTIEGLLDQAKVSWESISADVNANKYIVHPDWMPVGTTKEGNIKEVKNGMVYLSAWADLEKAKLTAAIADPNKFIEKDVNTAITLCETAITSLGGISKSSDYINLDAILTLAGLKAKLARFKDDDGLRLEAQVLYKNIYNNTPIKDIKALAKAGEISMDIELGSFNWDDADQVLKDYFDPISNDTKTILKSHFASKSYSYMSIELLEAQIRNLAKRTKRTDLSKISTEGKVSDYKMASVRADHVIKYANQITAIRDKSAIVDLISRAMLEKAKANALEAMTKTATNDKIKAFEAALTQFEAIFTYLGETKEGIVASKGKGKMDVAFYVSLLNEIANYNEQIGWLENKDLATKVMKHFNEATALYGNVQTLCDTSKSKYDRLARKNLIDLQLKGIELATLQTDIIVESSDAANTIIGKLDTLITAISEFEAPNGISDITKKKLTANIDRMLLDAKAKKLFFINKQKQGIIADQEATIKALIKEITEDERRKVEVKGKLVPVSLVDCVLPAKGEDCLLDDVYYPVLTMMGVYSLNLRFDPKRSADKIADLYTEYPKKRSSELTYDMVDALANAAVILKNADIRKDVLDRLSSLATDSVDKAASLSRPEDAAAKAKLNVIACKAYIWTARLNSWSFDEKTATSSKLLDNAITAYGEAIKLFSNVKGDQKQGYYENSPTLATITEELLQARFSKINFDNKGDSGAKARIDEYVKISKELADIIDGKKATDVKGLTPELAKTVQYVDLAAKIKANADLATIYMAASEPLENKSVTPATIAGISGLEKDVASAKDLFIKAAALFLTANNSAPKRTELGDAQLLAMGVDKTSLIAKEAQSYMIIALKSDSEAITKVAASLQTALDAAMDKKSPSPSAEAEIRMVRGNLYMWRFNKVDNAITEYETALERITGKPIAAIKESKYDGVAVKYLVNYAEARAVKMYQSKNDAAVKDVETIYNVISGSDAGKEYAFFVLRKKAELVLSTMDEQKGDQKVHVKRLKEAITNLYNAFIALGEKSVIVDDMSSVIAAVRAKPNNQYMVEMLCLLIEADQRLYSIQSKTRTSEWKAKFDNVNAAREIVITFLNKQYSQVKITVADALKLKKALDDDLKPKNKELARTLRRVCISRAEIIQAGKKTGVSAAAAIGSAEYNEDLALNNPMDTY